MLAPLCGHHRRAGVIERILITAGVAVAATFAVWIVAVVATLLNQVVPGGIMAGLFVVIFAALLYIDASTTRPA